MELFADMIVNPNPQFVLVGEAQALMLALTENAELLGKTPEQWLENEIDGYIEYVKEDDPEGIHRGQFPTKSSLIAKATKAKNGSANEKCLFIIERLDHEALDRLGHDIATARMKTK